MPNRLASATSPYLLQHADNPVDWWEWGEEAFAEARERNVPVLLSVGYAACHWCHVMAHESFEDDATAAYMNEHFVNVKVDREERPDVDAVYMQATTAMTGHGGWPMTCVLDHDGYPFFAGTYFPDQPRHGQPAFTQVLQALSDAWRDRGEEVRGVAATVRQHLEAAGGGLGSRAVDASVLEGAVLLLEREYDATAGGFGSAPKFPPSMVLEFLRRYYVGGLDTSSLVPHDGSPSGSGYSTNLRAGEMLAHTAAAMAGSGMYDQVGGGFARYAVDRDWVVPHFEKMLYDNALLLGFYARLDGLDTSSPSGSDYSTDLDSSDDSTDLDSSDYSTDLDGSDYSTSLGGSGYSTSLGGRIARETADFLLRELRTAEGGFASALDADSLHPVTGRSEEGAFYVWTPEQLVEALGHDRGAWAAELFGVTEEGTFEHGTSTLQLRAFPTKPGEQVRLSEVRARLLDARELRPRPARDDKVVAAWNGLAISGLCDAGTLLGEPSYVAAAITAAELIERVHVVPGDHGRRLLRVSRDGVAGRHEGVLEDYGCVASGLLSLVQATGDARWLRLATALLDEAIAGFGASDGGFFDTHREAEALPTRPRDPGDNASPSGLSSMVHALVSAHALTGEGRYRSVAEAALATVGPLLEKAPRFAGWSLAAAHTMLDGPLEVAVVGPAGLERDALEARARRIPGAVVVVADDGRDDIPLLAGRTAVDGAPAAYVCRGFVCERPVTDPDALGGGG